jgi:hypothetical protein
MGVRCKSSARRPPRSHICSNLRALKRIRIDTTGELELRRTRTRFADAPERLTMPLGGGTYSGPVVAEAQPADDEFRPTNLMERGSKEVERNPGLTSAELVTLIGAKRQWSLRALSLLVAEGYVRAERDGKTRRHHSIKPY